MSASGPGSAKWHSEAFALMRKRLNDFLSSSGFANQVFRRELSEIKREGLQCFIFGGFARSIYLHGAEASPKDVDLVFRRSEFERFLRVFSSSVRKINRFGGANLNLGGVDVDAWPLEETWAFRQGYFDGPTFPSLPATTYLSSDGIAIELWPREGCSRRVYSRGFFETFRAKILSVNFDPNPFPDLTLLRTLVAAKRNQLACCPDLARSSAKLWMSCNCEKVYDVQIKHYKAEIISLDEIKDIGRRLMMHVNKTPHNVFSMFDSDYQRSLVLLDQAALNEASVITEKRIQMSLWDHGDLGRRPVHSKAGLKTSFLDS